MRLIDADKLIEELTNTINEWIVDMPDGEYLKGNVNFSVLARDMIKEQLTAFDVDKVVEQLECEEGTVCGHKLINKNCFGCEGCDDCKMEDAYRYAIEIVS